MTIAEAFSIPTHLIEAALTGGASPAALDWLRRVTPEELERLGLGDLPAVLLGDGAPLEVLLASWPPSGHRDRVLEAVLHELDQSRGDFVAYRLPSPASWVEIGVIDPDPRELERHTHPAAFAYPHAEALAREHTAMPYFFEPNPSCWTGTGKRDRYYVPGNYVPGGRNYPPHHALDAVVAGGASGVVIADERIAALVSDAGARGCRATRRGPLEAVPARIISWDGHGYGATFTILDRTDAHGGGFDLVCESIH